jgi:hypothetical protein
MYGRWLPALAHLDRDWVASRVNQIFPRHRDDSSLRDAAWETYVVLCNPYHDLYEILRGEYDHAIRLVGRRTGKRARLRDPDRALGEHLVGLYWVGVLGGISESNPLGRLLASASDDIRGELMRFVGMSLRKAVEEIPPEQLGRLKSLWEFRVNAAESAGSKAGFRKEMASFGWWFAAGKFDVEWSLVQLRVAVRLADRVEPENRVVNRLAELVSDKPRESVECLAAIVKATSEEWELYGYREQAKAIIEAVLKGDDDQARRRGVDVAEHLGARGYLEFRDYVRAPRGT